MHTVWNIPVADAFPLMNIAAKNICIPMWEHKNFRSSMSTFAKLLAENCKFYSLQSVHLFVDNKNYTRAESLSLQT